MEYVFINYVTGRLVRVDGKEWGITNSTLMVEKGHHIFDLGEPPDYQPASIQTVVQGTTIVSPMIIDDFQSWRGDI
jgi:hypothetical protein